MGKFSSADVLDDENSSQLELVGWKITQNSSLDH
jgi:hypothetical protein